MYKLNIGVGFSVLQLYYLPHNNKSYLMDVIGQHRVILSEKIINYYTEEADELFKEAVETYIDSIAYADDTHVYYNSSMDDEISARDEMIMFVEQNPMKILFSEIEEFKTYNTKKVKIVTPEQMLNREKTALYKYSFPLSNYYVGIDENCEAYATWFGHLFEGEPHIEIQDKFIMSSKGIECLKKYYFPHIPKGSVVDIYCEIIEGVTKQDICNQLEDSFFYDWDIHVYSCRHMHDRYIQFDGIQISVGAGLDFLHLSGKTKKACTINITNYKDGLPLPEIIECVV